MVYTRRNPAVLIMGLLLLGLGYAASSGLLDPTLKWLAADKLKGEMAYLPYLFGALAVVIGLWQLTGRHAPGDIDYYTSAIGGAIFVLAVAMAVRWFLDPLVAVWSKSAGPIFGGKYIHDVFGLNYIVLGILAGILIVNVTGVPSWAENGVRLSRVGLKTGVILLGTLYFLQELLHLGTASFTLIGIFVLGSVAMTLWMGRAMHIPSSMGGVLSAGVGVCGVSAAVASAPVVQAKSAEIAYTIGTILLWGVGCMFLFPTIGKMLDLSHEAFGAWAGTGILNSAQVAGAALAFDPHGIQTLKVAEIFNITRVLFLPIIVVWLAAWYVKREAGAQKVDLSQVLIAKFPVFVLGFLGLFILSTMGVFAPAGHYQGKYFSSEQVKEDKLLKEKDLAALQAALPKVTAPADNKALQDLIAARKVSTRDQDVLLRGVAKMEGLDKGAKDALGNAHKAAWHDSKIIKAYRDWIAWLFAFGLTGLGMQITVASIKQAGGKPLIIGSVVGLIKAVGSLIVVLLFVREFI